MQSLNQIHKIYKKITQTLIRKKMTITTMESCTSGFIASLITDTQGASAVFSGACITYCNEAKILQGVEKSIIDEFGVYSMQTALAMASASLKMYPSNIGIGITGTFGNVDTNNADSVVGKVFVAIKYNLTNGKNENVNEMYELCEEYDLPQNISRFESKICVAEKVAEMIEKFL